MKAKYIGILLLALLFMYACDDNTGTLGMDMLPGSDEISAHTKEFDVMTRSVKADRIYSKTSTGYVGRFTDPEFGYYESSFITELNCTDHFTFPEVYAETEWDASGNATHATGELAGDSVVAVSLVLFYDSWFGDSLNACRMSVYELNDEWLEARRDAANYRFTDMDAGKYYDADGLLGRRAYSAYDVSVPDSVRKATDYYGNSTYTPNVNFTLDKEKWGNRILRLNRAYERGENNYFDNADRFIENILHGLYVKNDYGDGTILYVYQAALQMMFRLHAVNAETGVKLAKKVTDEAGEAGSDSLYYGWQTFFASTKEVIQANRFANSEKLDEKVNETDCTYIKSPAGIYTEATLPYDEIAEALANDTLNAVSLAFTNYYRKSDYEFSMDVPANVLLVRKQDADSFFSGNKLADNVTSYLATHNSSNKYVFSNIARLVTACLGEKNEAKEAAGSSWDEAAWEAGHPDWDKVWLVPVSLTYDSNGMSSSSTPGIIGIQNDLQPGYAKLEGGPQTNAAGELANPLKLEVTYTSFH